MSNIPASDRKSLMIVGLTMTLMGCMFGMCVGTLVARAMLNANIATTWVGITVLIGLAFAIWMFNFITRVGKLA